MIQVHLDESSVLKLIVGFLSERGYAKSSRCLEKETGISFLHEEDPDLTYLRDTILDARFSDCESFLEPIIQQDSSLRRKVMFQLKRQQFLERLYDSSSLSSLESSLSSAVVSVVQQLQQIRDLCDASEFNSLWYTLTLERIDDHPDLRGWTPEKGRVECFRTISSLLKDQLGDAESSLPKGQLLHLLAQASTLKMEPLWRGSESTPDRFMADLIFRVKPSRSSPLAHSKLPFACQVGVHANLNPIRRSGDGSIGSTRKVHVSSSMKKKKRPPSQTSVDAIRDLLSTGWNNPSLPIKTPDRRTAVVSLRTDDERIGDDDILVKDEEREEEVEEEDIESQEEDIKPEGKSKVPEVNLEQSYSADSRVKTQQQQQQQPITHKEAWQGWIGVGNTTESIYQENKTSSSFKLPRRLRERQQRFEEHRRRRKERRNKKQKSSKDGEKHTAKKSATTKRINKRSGVRTEQQQQQQQASKLGKQHLENIRCVSRLTMSHAIRAISFDKRGDRLAIGM